jgi:hypothetical protein
MFGEFVGNMRFSWQYDGLLKTENNAVHCPAELGGPVK